MVLSLSYISHDLCLLARKPASAGSVLLSERGRFFWGYDFAMSTSQHGTIFQWQPICSCMRKFLIGATTAYGSRDGIFKSSYFFTDDSQGPRD